MTNVKPSPNALSVLADPTRQRILERLREGPQPVGALARGLPITRPAVSQHLRALKDAGLVTDRAEGTRRVYQIDPKGLGEIRRWLDQFWDRALAAFQDAVEASEAARPARDQIDTADKPEKPR